MTAFDLERIGGLRGYRLLVDEVLAAGEEALALFRSGAGKRYETKADRSPVTEADRAVEERLRSFVGARYPDAAFFGEESGQKAGSSPLRFVVDPIDGTRAFLRGLPTWSVLLGVEADDEPVLGVAFMPAAGDLFTGYRGGGAFANGRPVHLSTTESIDQALVAHGALQQFTDTGLGDALIRLGQRVYTARGLADFDGYRQVLLGRADAMIDPGVKPYDVCPAAVLIREAGGTFTDLDGAPTIHGNGALASNGRVHDALLAVVQGR